MGVLVVPLSAVLVVAGASKLFSPRQLAQGLLLVAGGRQRRTTAEVVSRGVGLLELTAAILVSLPATMRAGAILGVVIGLSIAGWVILAQRRHVKVLCGCFGGNAAKSLDARNAISDS